jgi:DNA invertase Pin-like site-specific DNA recombinase
MTRSTPLDTNLKKKEKVMGIRVGYARVSSSGQKLDLQMDRLADCDRIYHEKASAASAKGRPELQKALDFVRDEDVFVVTKLDRLARSVVDLAEIVQKLEAKKVVLWSWTKGSIPRPCTVGSSSTSLPQSVSSREN